MLDTKCETLIFCVLAEKIKFKEMKQLFDKHVGGTYKDFQNFVKKVLEIRKRIYLNGMYGN